MSDDHSLVGAWALDAVDLAERDRVERHLETCPSCAEEAAELRETAARLADATVAEPPPRLREAVLAEARRTRQEAPPEPNPRGSVRRSRAGNHGRRLRLALGAAALAVVAAFAGVVATWSVLRGADDEGDRIAAVLEAADAEVAFQEAEGGGRVTVVSSAALDQAVVVVSDLADVDDDRSYQVWLVDEAGQVSAGVMDAGDSSATMLVDGLGDTQVVGVTNEPAGGSAEPTLPMVADVSLTA